MRHLLAIYDNKAQDLAGTPFLVRHYAQGVRMFGDAARAPDSPVRAHVEDYDLICLAMIDDDNPTLVTPSYEVIITGEQWKNSQLEREP